MNVEDFFSPNYIDRRTVWFYRISCMVFIAYYVGCLYYCHNHNGSLAAKLLVLSWVIGPPLWFYFEYVALMGGFGLKTLRLQLPKTVEGFKYSQDLAFKLWIAAASILFYVAGLKIP